MKNIYSLLIAFFLIFVSCERELDYGSTFDFKINNLDNSSITVKSDKTFTIGVDKIFNKSNSKNFKIKYTCENISIFDDKTPLIQNNFYPITLNENNLIPLTLNIKDKGDYTIIFTMTDEFGATKEKKVLVRVVEDFKYSFIAQNPKPLYEDIITSTFSFSFSLENIGATSDTYKIKSFSSLKGVTSINGNLAVENQLTPVTLGNITATFTPDIVGEQTITFIVINSQNLEKEVTFNLNVKPKAFTVLTPASFTTKETLNKNFTFNLGNTIPNWKYQVKFSSQTLAKISNANGTEIPLNTFVPLTDNTNAFTFNYLSNSNGNDVVTIVVKDQFNQEVSAKSLVTVYSKPTIASIEGKIYSEMPNNLGLGSSYLFMGETSFGGATITNYEIKILNYATGNYDVFTSKENKNLYANNFSYFEYFGSKTYDFDNNKWIIVPNYIRVTKENRQINYYWNMPYTARIQDSDGVWSNSITGTMTY